MADEQHVEIREIVVLEHEVVLRRQEGRAVAAFRLQQRRIERQFRRAQLAAVGGTKPSLIHSRDRLDDFGHADACSRHSPAHAPRWPSARRAPAFAGKLLGRRRKRIRHRAPDVDAAVAVEVDGVFVELRRQELREAHRPAPGRAHVGARHAVLQHLQRMQEFVAEEILALADISLRRQHADGVLAAKLARRSRFRAPRSPARHCRARRFLSRCAPACRDIARRVACRARSKPSNAASRRYCDGVCTNSGCCGCFSGLPGMARSGSE